MNLQSKIDYSIALKPSFANVNKLHLIMTQRMVFI